MKLLKTKRCSVCKQLKSTKDFCKHRRYKDGLHTYCRVCNVKKNREWAEKNPKKLKKIFKNYSSKMKRQVMDAYGGCCECCGESNIVFLTVDHIKGDGKKHREQTSGTWGVYRDLIKRDFPKQNYRVLCMNCNFAIRYGDPCPHKEKKYDEIQS